MNRLLLALPILLATGAARADLPAWVHEVVCPMVGPFNKDSGPPGKSLDQVLQDYHPEIAEWSALPGLKGNPLCPKGILGGLEYQEFPQSPESDTKLWLEEFGTRFQDTEDRGIDVPSGGKASDWKYGSDQNFTLWYMCHNSPNWHAFHRDSILRAARDPNCALVRQDNIGGPSGVTWDNGGWCRFCLAGFKDRVLKRFSAEELHRLGVDDPAGFDPGAWLRARLADKPEEKIENPLVREYTRFMLASNLAAWRDEVQAAHAVRADLPICGNQGGGNAVPYPTVLLSDVSDLIFLENSRRQYPLSENAVYYALALAGGRHSRPAWIWDFGTPEFMAQVDGSRLFVAECYANGATPYYEMNNLGYSAKKGYYAIPLSANTYDALARYAQFVHAHADLVTRGYAADARVALLYSLPSFVPKFCGAIGLGEGSGPAQTQAQHFLGFARALERNHVPYNVEVLGDEELWPDRDLPRRLAQYRVVLCPKVEALSNAQAEALDGFLRGGGRLVISGEFGTRDETFARRATPALARLAEQYDGRVIRLADEPVTYLRGQTIQESRGASQTVTVNQTEAKPLVVSGWSKADHVSGPNDGQYSLWVDATYQDGTPLWAQVAPFRPGTHDWERSEFVIHPAKPLKSVTVHALFRYHSGTVWFDDVFLGEEGRDVNLLKNPGFEGGDATKTPEWEAFLGWQKMPAGYVPDPAAPRSGKTSVRCEIPAPKPEDPAQLPLVKALREALSGAGPQLETSAPPTVFIRAVLKPDELIVHLLNLDYDDGADKVAPAGAFRLAIPLPSGTKSLGGPVKLLSPDGDQAETVLPHQVKGGRVEVEVPDVRVWSCVVLKRA